MSEASGRLAERFTTAADRFPLFDATIIYRPDLRPEAARPLAERMAARDEKLSESDHFQYLSSEMPPGAVSLAELRNPAANSLLLKIGSPRVPQGGVVTYGRPQWVVYVHWPKGDPTAGRLFTTLCGEAGELLGKDGKGDTTYQSWLIHLAERHPVKLVQDAIPPEDFPFQRVGWRETDGTDCVWWAVVMKNVLNLSVKALPELIPSFTPNGHKSPSVKSGRKQRGRKPVDPKSDGRVSAAWQSEQHPDLAALAHALGMKLAEVRKALDRERKRRKKAAG